MIILSFLIFNFAHVYTLVREDTLPAVEKSKVPKRKIYLILGLENCSFWQKLDSFSFNQKVDCVTPTLALTFVVVFSYPDRSLTAQ